MDKTNSHLLRLFGMPVFSNLDDLSELMSVDRGVLSFLVSCPQKNYKVFSIPKRTGGSRQIEAPSKRLKAIQAWILANILSPLAVQEQATAYRPGYSIRNNTSPHQDDNYFLLLDIKDFFPSIRYQRIYGIFRTIGYSEAAAYILTRLVCYDGRLPQGGVTSPTISNNICSRLDRRINGYAAKRKLNYTRYADDLALSGNEPESLRRAFIFATRVLAEEGFEVNKKKTRFLGPGDRCIITGLVLDEERRIFSVGRQKRRRMRSIIFHALHGRYKDEQYNTIMQIHGWLSFLKDIDRNAFETMQRYIKDKGNA